jgi:acyl carrier protein
MGGGRAALHTGQQIDRWAPPAGTARRESPVTSSHSKATEAPAAESAASRGETTVQGVRTILSTQGRLSVPIDDLSDTSDLHGAGLTSLATVSLMLALEDHFDVEFPDALLSRKTFSSINSLAAAIDALRAS